MQPPKTYTLAPITQPNSPDLGRLLQATIGDLTDNLAGYAMIGLGQMLLVLVATFVTIPLMYAGMFLLFGGGMAVSMVLAGIVAAITNSPELAALVSMLGTFFSFGCMFLGFFALLAGLIAVIAPVTASMNRAVAAHQRGEAKLEFNGTFSTVTQDVIPVVAVSAIVSSIVLLGVMFCYLPGFVAAALLSFAPTLVILHRRSPVDAVRTAVQHAIANPSFYLIFGVATIGISMVASYIPVIGPAFMVAFHVRAFRELFGDVP